MTIRQLNPADALALVSMRRQALEDEPQAFAASLQDDRVLSLEFSTTMLSDVGEQAVFGAFESELCGMIGLLRNSKTKYRHKAVIWGMYVAPGARHGGVGRALLDAAIAHARTWGIDQLLLTVTETAIPAKRLYESVGFRVWGREARALQWQGRFLAEEHLALDIRISTESTEKQNRSEGHFSPDSVFSMPFVEPSDSNPEVTKRQLPHADRAQ